MNRMAMSEQGPQDRVGEIDWSAIERSPEFQELVRSRRAFIFPAAVFSLGFFGVYLLLAAFADDFMGSQIVEGLPVAWLLAMLQVFMTWGVTAAYLRKSDRVFEPLERRAAALAEKAVEQSDATGHDHRDSEVAGK
jgi:uncharacterized membrane protein (DUF485 family)